MSKVEDAIEKAKEILPNVTPTPPGLKAESSVHDLKSRLEWGEPGLTIIDVRDRDTFNHGHIMGAVCFPMNEVVELTKSNYEANRDIYVYGASDQETSEAARMLRQAGFKNIAELKGGLEAWKAVAGSTEGIDETRAEPGKNAYNVVDNVKNHFERQEIDFEKP
ncbi:rhodanese-like domain-containing protein [Pseudanabaenaceae cyanobacterium LEGE 13415]|nr:rhodanese-like domain-containing protein [Pseudanabaenaceae cyanobacterium LEGE 13415]